MKWREVVGKMLPWAPRAQRQEAIGKARAEKERSQDAAKRAAEVEAQIKRLARANHYAEAITADILSGRNNPGGT